MWIIPSLGAYCTFLMFQTSCVSWFIDAQILSTLIIFMLYAYFHGIKCNEKLKITELCASVEVYALSPSSTSDFSFSFFELLCNSSLYVTVNIYGHTHFLLTSRDVFYLWKQLCFHLHVHLKFLIYRYVVLQNVFFCFSSRFVYFTWKSYTHRKRETEMQNLPSAGFRFSVWVQMPFLGHYQGTRLEVKSQELSWYPNEMVPANEMALKWDAGAACRGLACFTTVQAPRHFFCFVLFLIWHSLVYPDRHEYLSFPTVLNSS